MSRDFCIDLYYHIFFIKSTISTYNRSKHTQKSEERHLHSEGIVPRLFMILKSFYFPQPSAETEDKHLLLHRGRKQILYVPLTQTSI